jgi:hypothetical protein
VLRGFFLGFVRVHVLHHAAQALIYGLATLEALRRHGYELGPGTFYISLEDLVPPHASSRDLARVLGLAFVRELVESVKLRCAGRC